MHVFLNIFLFLRPSLPFFVPPNKGFLWNSKFRVSTRPEIVGKITIFQGGWIQCGKTRKFPVPTVSGFGTWNPELFPSFMAEPRNFSEFRVRTLEIFPVSYRNSEKFANKIHLSYFFLFSIDLVALTAWGQGWRSGEARQLRVRWYARQEERSRDSRGKSSNGEYYRKKKLLLVEWL